MKSRKKHNHFSAVRMLRIICGLTVSALAEAVDLNLIDISRIEQGRNCQINRYVRLANYFGVSVDALVKNDITAIAKTRKGPVDQKLALQEKMKKFHETCSRIGDKGQRLAFQWELERLDSMGSELVYMVNPNCADERRLGFDMLSFDDFSNPIFIEVKATKGPPDRPFRMSGSEVSKARECYEKGLIYQVHRIGFVDDPEKRALKIIPAEELLEAYDLKPTEYIVAEKGLTV